MDPITYTIALGAAAAGEEDSYWIFGTEDPNNYDSSGMHVQVDSNDNIYATITPTRSEHKASNLGFGYPTVIKLDKTGAVQLQRQLYHSSSSHADSKPSQTCADSSGNIYMTAARNGNIFEYVKLNSSGTQQYVKTTDTAAVKFYGAKCDSSGNLLCSGESKPGSYTSGQIMKIAPSGTVTWERALRTTSPGKRTYFYDMDVDSSGNSYVTGRTRIDTGYEAFLVAKLSSSGATTWQTTFQEIKSGYNNWGDHEGSGVSVDSSGNVFVVGKISGIDSILMKLNSSGTIQWCTKTSGSSTMMCVAADSDGNVYTLGRQSSSPYHFIFMKFNSSGTQQWVRSFGPTGNSMRGIYYFNNILQIDSNNNIIINGIYNPGYGIVVAKLPNDGSLTGTHTMGSPLSPASFVYASATVTMNSMTVSTDIDEDVPTSSELINYDVNSTVSTGDFTAGTYTANDTKLITIS
mgnify:CR=1 FL=1|tara:strand:- start:596 stop:1981 length:1386 start_codon:yes stop_codon:yes gene_type:complete